MKQQQAMQQQQQQQLQTQPQQAQQQQYMMMHGPIQQQLPPQIMMQGGQALPQGHMTQYASQPPHQIQQQQQQTPQPIARTQQLQSLAVHHHPPTNIQQQQQIQALPMQQMHQQNQQQQIQQQPPDSIFLDDLYAKKFRIIGKLQNYRQAYIPQTNKMNDVFNSKVNTRLGRDQQHWDLVMQEMRMMAYDFQEEGKLKKALQYHVAKRIKKVELQKKAHVKEIQMYHKVLASQISTMVCDSFQGVLNKKQALQDDSYVKLEHDSNDIQIQVTDLITDVTVMPAQNNLGILETEQSQTQAAKEQMSQVKIEEEVPNSAQEGEGQDEVFKINVEVENANNNNGNNLNGNDEPKVKIIVSGEDDGKTSLTQLEHQDRIVEDKKQDYLDNKDETIQNSIKPEELKGDNLNQTINDNLIQEENIIVDMGKIESKPFSLNIQKIPFIPENDAQEQPIQQRNQHHGIQKLQERNENFISLNELQDQNCMFKINKVQIFEKLKRSFQRWPKNKGKFPPGNIFEVLLGGSSLSSLHHQQQSPDHKKGGKHSYLSVSQQIAQPTNISQQNIVQQPSQSLTQVQQLIRSTSSTVQSNYILKKRKKPAAQKQGEAQIQSSTTLSPFMPLQPLQGLVHSQSMQPMPMHHQSYSGMLPPHQIPYQQHQIVTAQGQELLVNNNKIKPIIVPHQFMRKDLQNTKKLKMVDNMDEILSFYYNDEAIRDTGDYQQMFPNSIQQKGKFAKSFESLDMYKFNRVESKYVYDGSDLIEQCSFDSEFDKLVLDRYQFFEAFQDYECKMRSLKNNLCSIQNGNEIINREQYSDDLIFKSDLKQYLQLESNSVFLYTKQKSFRIWNSKKLQQWPFYLYFILDKNYNKFGNKWYMIAEVMQMNPISKNFQISNRNCEEHWIFLMQAKCRRMINLDQRVFANNYFLQPEKQYLSTQTANADSNFQEAKNQKTRILNTQIRKIAPLRNISFEDQESQEVFFKVRDIFDEDIFSSSFGNVQEMQIPQHYKAHPPAIQKKVKLNNYQQVSSHFSNEQLNQHDSSSVVPSRFKQSHIMSYQLAQFSLIDEYTTYQKMYYSKYKQAVELQKSILSQGVTLTQQQQATATQQAGQEGPKIETKIEIEMPTQMAQPVLDEQQSMALQQAMSELEVKDHYLKDIQKMLLDPKIGKQLRDSLPIQAELQAKLMEVSDQNYTDPNNIFALKQIKEGKVVEIETPQSKLEEAMKKDPDVKHIRFYRYSHYNQNVSKRKRQIQEKTCPLIQAILTECNMSKQKQMQQQKLQQEHNQKQFQQQQQQVGMQYMPGTINQQMQMGGNQSQSSQSQLVPQMGGVSNAGQGSLPLQQKGSQMGQQQQQYVRQQTNIPTYSNGQPAFKQQNTYPQPLAQQQQSRGVQNPQTTPVRQQFNQGGPPQNAPPQQQYQQGVPGNPNRYPPQQQPGGYPPTQNNINQPQQSMLGGGGAQQVIQGRGGPQPQQQQQSQYHRMPTGGAMGQPQIRNQQPLSQQNSTMLAMPPQQLSQGGGDQYANMYPQQMMPPQQQQQQQQQGRLANPNPHNNSINIQQATIHPQQQIQQPSRGQYTMNNFNNLAGPEISNHLDGINNHFPVNGLPTNPNVNSNQQQNIGLNQNTNIEQQQQQQYQTQSATQQNALGAQMQQQVQVQNIPKAKRKPGNQKKNLEQQQQVQGDQDQQGQVLNQVQQTQKKKRLTAKQKQIETLPDASKQD